MSLYQVNVSLSKKTPKEASFGKEHDFFVRENFMFLDLIRYVISWGWFDWWVG